VSRSSSAKTTAENDVLGALSTIIDPDFGMDIVSCGFVKDMNIDAIAGKVCTHQVLS
jgi:metal-sulfur cluster biosynthetic enzyme